MKNWKNWGMPYIWHIEMAMLEIMVLLKATVLISNFVSSNRMLIPYLTLN